MNKSDEDAIFERVNAHQLANEQFNEDDETFCKWGYDSEFEHSHYISKCGFEFQFSDDRNSPTEYDFNFCPKCGKKIMELQND